MKIKCYILRKDRTATVKQVDPNKGTFRFNEGLYLLNKKAVNLVDREATPELIFIEGNPNPVFNENKKEVTDNTKKTKKDTTPEPTLLDHQVMKNALKVTGAPRGLGLDIIADYMKDPTKILMLVFAIIIFVAFIGGYF